MATDQPYNELGQILSTGGEIALGLAILQDLGKEGFLLFFTRRFSPIRDEDRETLISLSESMIEGGVIIDHLKFNEAINLDDIPLNQFLFGGNLEGRRILITGEVQVPGANSRVQLRIPFPDTPTVEEMREAFMARSFDIIRRYPEKFGLPAGFEPTIADVFILLPERAF